MPDESSITLRDQADVKWGGQYADEDRNYLVHQIHLERFDLHIEGAQLLTDANLKLTPGHRYGVVGGNGVGKTTLLRHLGEKKFKGMWRGHQTALYIGECGAGSVNVDGDHKVIDVLLTVPDEGEAMKCYEAKIEVTGEGGLRSEGCKILVGLGFSTEQINSPISHLSGGWRARLDIATTLLLEPDLLLLDEPTNHLDIETSIWLQDFLATYKKILVLVTHDLEPLNTVCTDIISLNDKTLTQYQGNYYGYLKTVTDTMAQQANQQQWEEVKKKRLEETISYLKAKGEHGTVSSKNKALERVGRQKTDTGKKWKYSTMGDRVRTLSTAVNTDPVTFRFQSDKRVRNLGDDEVVLEGKGLSFAYPSHPDKAIFNNVDVKITPTSRIALIGKNGSGKSTLLSVLSKTLQPTSGTVETLEEFRVGYYQQDHIHKLPLKNCAMEWLLHEHHGARPQDVRDQLNGFGINPTTAELPLGVLSAGQRARVVLASVTLGRPSLLVLDEPTNHLDLESQAAVIDALGKFKAACIVVTHSEYLIEACCNEIWTFSAPGTFEILKETFADWKTAFLRKIQTPKPSKIDVEKPKKWVASKNCEEPQQPKLAPPKNLGGKKGVVTTGGGVRCRVCKGDHFTHQCDKKKENDVKKAELEAKRKEKQQQKMEMKAALSEAPTSYRDTDGETWNVVIPKGMKKNRR